MLREADGSVKLVVTRPHTDGKVFAPGCASKNRTVRAEEHKRSNKKNASMILGISMGQETCLIHGQVSLNLLYWKKKLLTDICGPGRD